jgi:hypothetical protein
MTELKKILEKKFVSEDGHDLCVICKVKTPNKTNLRIDMRNNYVEGCGQLCNDCYTKYSGEIEIK